MRALTALLLPVLLAACGQTGDLYLPGTKAEPVAAPAPTAAPQAKKK